MLRSLESGPVLIEGLAGTGKTALLQMASDELREDGATVLLVSLADRRSVGEAVLDHLNATLPVRVLSASGEVSPREVASALDAIAQQLRKPCLFLDGLDEHPFPTSAAAFIEDLARRVHGWHLAVASRRGEAFRGSYLSNFKVIALGGLSLHEAGQFLARKLPDSASDLRDRLADLADGSPLLLDLLVSEVSRHGFLPEELLTT